MSVSATSSWGAGAPRAREAIRGCRKKALAGKPLNETTASESSGRRGARRHSHESKRIQSVPDRKDRSQTRHFEGHAGGETV